MVSHAEQAWREQLVDAFAGLAAIPITAGPPSGSLRSVSLGDVGLYDVRGSEQAVRRTPSAVRRTGLDQLKVCLQVRGRAVMTQADAQVSIAPGELAIYDLGKPYQLTFSGSWRCAVMTLPRTALDVPAATLTGLMRRAHPAARGAGRLLAGYLRDCLEPVTASCVDGTGTLGRAGVALLASALAHDADRAVDGGADTARRGVMEYVRRNLADPELSPTSVARAHTMSPRSLQRLFQDEDRTVAGLIHDHRLEAVRRDLADPLLAGRTIAGIAARHGVHDQAWLSHAFREHYGDSPSRYRRDALCGQPAGSSPA